MSDPCPNKIANRFAAKRNYSLTDFQRAAIDLDEAIGEAYRQAIALKGMWDTFEEIPPKQLQMYKDTMKVMGILRKARDEAYQTRMTLKRYRAAKMRMDRNRLREMFDNGGYISVWTGPKSEEKMREYGLEIPPPRKSGPVYYKGKKVGFMDNWAGLKLQDESFVMKHIRFLEGFNWMYTNG